MIIIVDGPDGSGKSTLIEKLLMSHPGSHKVHFGTPADDAAAYAYWEVYAQAIKEAGTASVVIFDRSWLSDMVYGPVMRGRQEMTALHAEMLEGMVVSHGGGLVIYCTAPTRTLWMRCNSRGETYIKSIEQLDEIASLYIPVMKNCSLPVIRYDTAARW